MTDWTHTYRQEQIPGANPAGVINAHRPGRQIADAITELQERAITDATLDAQGGLTGSVEVEDGTLILSLRSDDVAPPPEPYEPSGESGPCTNIIVAFNPGNRVLTISGTTLVANNGLVVSSQPFSVQAAIPQTGGTGATDTVTVVTNVRYDNASRTFIREVRNLVFNNGSLVSANTPTEEVFLTLREFTC
jgi:hypothetical protein